MSEIRLRRFEYKCRCGYTVNVFIDFGVPQNVYRCRSCGSEVQRKEF